MRQMLFRQRLLNYAFTLFFSVRNCVLSYNTIVHLIAEKRKSFKFRLPFHKSAPTQFQPEEQPMTESGSPVQISVLMPLYNAEQFVGLALNSILQERRLSLEVIVIDDGSTDYSLERVCRLQDDRIRIISNPGKGIATALNAGLAIARGEVLTRCDADDLYPLKRLMRQTEWLVQHPDYGAVCGGYSAINPRGVSIIRLDCGGESEDITAELQMGITRTHLCTYAIRTEILRSLGGFRPYFYTGEDIDLQLRLSEHCKVWYIPDVHYYYRLHSTSITHTQGSAQREFFNTIARELQKQRRLSGIDDVERGYPPMPPRKEDRPYTAALHIQGFLLSQAWQEFGKGQRWQALSTGARSLLTQPGNLTVWRSFIMLAIKSARGRGISCKTL